MSDGPVRLFSTWFGVRQLHSGDRSAFLIDCDALTDQDLAALALEVASRFRWRAVRGVPRGGSRFAAALDQWSVPHGGLPLLIVDDVWTTGASMRQARDDCEGEMVLPLGVVIFARSVPEPWVWPLFSYAV